MTARSKGALGLASAALAVVLWWSLPVPRGGLGPAAVPSRSEGPGQPPAGSPRSQRETPKPGETAEPGGAATLPQTGAIRRSGAVPVPSLDNLALRAQVILDSYREKRDARHIGALLRPRALPGVIREALRITVGFSPEERAAAIAEFQRHNSDELRRVVESLASSENDPAVRNLALDLLQALTP